MSPLDSDLFRQIVETFPVGTYVVGLDRRIAFWNKAAEPITGYLSQEVIGRPCHAYLLVHCGARGTPVCEECRSELGRQLSPASGTTTSALVENSSKEYEFRRSVIPTCPRSCGSHRAGFVLKFVPFAL
jgi:PAS domain-containing protein